MVPLTYPQLRTGADPGDSFRDFDRTPLNGRIPDSHWGTALKPSRPLVHVTELQVARLKVERAEARVKVMMDRLRRTPRTHPDFVTQRDELHRLRARLFLSSTGAKRASQGESTSPLLHRERSTKYSSSCIRTAHRGSPAAPCGRDGRGSASTAPAAACARQNVTLVRARARR